MTKTSKANKAAAVDNAVANLLASKPSVAKKKVAAKKKSAVEESTKKQVDEKNNGPAKVTKDSRNKPPVATPSKARAARTVKPAPAPKAPSSTLSTFDYVMSLDEKLLGLTVKNPVKPESLRESISAAPSKVQMRIKALANMAVRNADNMAFNLAFAALKKGPQSRQSIIEYMRDGKSNGVRSCSKSTAQTQTGNVLKVFDLLKVTESKGEKYALSDNSIFVKRIVG